LALHLIGIGDQDADRTRSGEAFGSHKSRPRYNYCVNDKCQELSNAVTERRPSGTYLCGKLSAGAPRIPVFPDIAQRHEGMAITVDAVFGKNGRHRKFVLKPSSSPLSRVQPK
jgi:hypothetical protein